MRPLGFWCMGITMNGSKFSGWFLCIASTINNLLINNSWIDITLILIWLERHKKGKKHHWIIFPLGAYIITSLVTFFFQQKIVCTLVCSQHVIFMYYNKVYSWLSPTNSILRLHSLSEVWFLPLFTEEVRLEVYISIYKQDAT